MALRMLTPYYGTSGTNLKKSLDEDQAEIHGNQIKKRSKESDDGFSL
jgi:hypothetical protein